jgi:hypothetical protein
VAFAEEGSIGVMRGIDIVIDALFLVDVYVNMRTGMYNKSCARAMDFAAAASQQCQMYG